MMYASPIEINPNPKQIENRIVLELPGDPFTLESLTKFLYKHAPKNETLKSFNFWAEMGPSEDCAAPRVTILTTRMETPEEVATRVARQEKYMEGYRAFHAKYPRK